jgi:hypothetical protein
MFEKIFKKEKNDLTQPDMPNRVELLKEIRNNNCREIITMGINLKVLGKDSTLYPDKSDQINEALKLYRGKMKDLIIGVEYIDKELKEYEKNYEGGKRV